MAQKCGNCRSTDVTTGVDNDVSCLICGTHGPHAYANGEPAPAKTVHKTAAKKAVK